MPLPPSFLRDGFVSPDQARRKAGTKLRRLMIASEGGPDTGKTEFLLSAPGPGIVVCLDRGFDAVYDNPTPPITRREDFAFHIVTAPTATQAQQSVYLEHWTAFKKKVYTALDNPDALTVGLDGDSDSWELQRLAEHGKLTQVFPQTRYTDVYAARRAFYNRLWDSGKIIISTSKVKAEYRDMVDPRTGETIMDPQTKEPKRERTGGVERQGFPDMGYLWQIQIRHLFKPPSEVKGRAVPPSWGLQILRCKANTELMGAELWGSDCTFRGLVELCYPHVDPKEWGL